ncbi:hypothetical protein SMICM17S_07165 [Streptomyces microflavus]
MSTARSTRAGGRSPGTKVAWGPVHGVVIHHTVGTDPLAVCYGGMKGLPGPLCHKHLAKSGVASMLSAGRANHAGTFAQNAYSAMLNESSTHPRPSCSEPVDGNRYTYGIEIENLGNGKDFYTKKQYDAAVRWAAAICRFHGWGARSVIGHKEGTTRRSTPKGPIGSADGPQFDMGQFRKDVTARLAEKGEKPKPPAPTEPATPTKPAPAKPAVPTVDLSNLIAAARRDPSLKQGGTTHPADVKIVEAALQKEGLLGASYAKDWQLRQPDQGRVRRLAAEVGLHRLRGRRHPGQGVAGEAGRQARLQGQGVTHGA